MTPSDNKGAHDLSELASQLPPDENMDAWMDDILSYGVAAGLQQDEAKDETPAAKIKPFILDGVAPCVQQAHKACKEWVLRIARRANSPYPLYLLGPSGCGKSHLAKNSLALLRQRGGQATYAEWAKVIRDMREGDCSYILHSLGQAHVLILDDVGAENVGSEYAQGYSCEKLCELLNLRAGKWTLITSNFYVGQFAEKYDTRISSRMFRDDSVIIEMRGAEDYERTRYAQRLTE